MRVAPEVAARALVQRMAAEEVVAAQEGLVEEGGLTDRTEGG